MADDRSKLEIDIADKLKRIFGVLPIVADAVAADLMPMIDDAIDTAVDNAVIETVGDPW